MPATLVVGAQWGDEGKGKVIDVLTAEADVVVRYQGGSNAGHTVVVGAETYVLHLIPSGMLYPGKMNVIGNGVVVDPARLVEEIDTFKARGIDVESRLLLSDLAHVTLPYHKRLDEAREAKRGSDKIGTTHQGIGPTYSDKYGRVGIKVGDLADEADFTEKVRRNLEEKNAFFREYYHAPEMSMEEVLGPYRAYWPRLKGLVRNTIPYLRDELKAGKRILLEGAQGTLLDVDFGTYPYVSASHPTAGGSSAGSGIPPRAIVRVVGVVKAYTTRVGAGPLPTELPAEEQERLRMVGREYGATTGRARRCGWFDAVVVRRAVDVNGLTEVAVTKLDILDHLDEVPVCVAYRYRGQELTEFPTRTEVVAECEPVYRMLPGWKSPTSGIRRWADLPANAKGYIETLQSLMGVTVSIVSIGPRRDEIIRV
ncbi:MAG: adenylosuccinate synthase [Candidatus Coatesbacteria bacterium]